jgi:hypothetical protein
MAAQHVQSDYRHQSKQAVAHPAVTLRGALLKYYEIALAHAPVPAEIGALALRFLSREAERQDWPLDGDIGFVMLHRCGADFYFLIVCTWRGNNEIWETVYAKPDAATLDFALFPQGAHKGTFCIWEASVVTHEVLAWTRYLKSPRGPADLDAYLADKVEGDVG